MQYVDQCACWGGDQDWCPSWLRRYGRVEPEGFVHVEPVCPFDKNLHLRLLVVGGGNFSLQTLVAFPQHNQESRLGFSFRPDWLYLQVVRGVEEDWWKCHSWEEDKVLIQLGGVKLWLEQMPRVVSMKRVCEDGRELDNGTEVERVEKNSCL